ncbi:MAG: DUF4179 domain-containing protein [Romboutsia sp.]
MKDKFEILNDVKIDVDEYKEIEFDNNDEFKNKMKSKLRNKKSKYKKGIAVASIVLIVGGGFLFTDKGWAQIKHLWYTIDEVLNMKKEEIEDYKYNINKTVEDEDIKVTFKNIMLDNGNIVIDMNIDDTRLNPYEYYTKEEQEKYSVDKWVNEKTRVELGAEGVEVYVDGKKMTYKSSTMAPNSNERKKDNTTDLIAYQSIAAIGKENDEYYREEVSKDKFPYVIDKNKVYNFKLKVKKIYISQSEYTEEEKNQNGRYGTVVYGDWSIDVDINGKDLKNNVESNNRNNNINLEYNNKDINVDLEQVEISQLGITLKYRMDNINEIFGFKIVNDKDEEYQFSGDSGDSEGDKFEFMRVEAEYLNTTTETDYIRLIPFIRDNGKEVEYEDKSIEIKIDK